MKIKFYNEEQLYTIMVQDKRYLICQRPYTVQENIEERKQWFNELEIDIRENEDIDKEILYKELVYKNGEPPEVLSEDTYMYTIVDLKEKIRGTDNYVFSPYDYSKLEDCVQCLNDLNIITHQHGSYKEYKTEISKRNRVYLGEFEILN